jgi:hypothetical protein
MRNCVFFPGAAALAHSYASHIGERAREKISAEICV